MIFPVPLPNSNVALIISDIIKGVVAKIWHWECEETHEVDNEI